MKTYQFKCTLLADVVMTANTATEGTKDSLDYIPGSKFLGIAAGKLYPSKKEYKENSTKTLDIFHNGTVRFGDALPLIKGEIGYRIPFSWYYKKGKSIEDGIYLHHAIDQQAQDFFKKKGIQPKQQRSGYITKSGKWLKKIEERFSIKSAYDIEKRRSKDSQMYGYFALPKGSTWTFTIEDDSERYIDEIKDALEGSHRIGRSRSAQYGLVKICFQKEIPFNSSLITCDESVLFYAASNLVFYDDNGHTALTPHPVKHLKLPEKSKIDWAKSQIRTRVYQTWNRHRFNRDADRYIIEKGSVISCRLGNSIELSGQIRLGSHQSEGFGQVLINPDFLKPSLSPEFTLNFNVEEIKFKNWINVENKAVAILTSPEDETLIAYLKARKERESAIDQVDIEANKFVEDHKDIYKGLNPSQWGMVRNYAKHAANSETLKKLLFEESVGCLQRGKSEEQWRKKDRRGKLKKYLFEENEGVDPIQLVICIASEMSKSK